MEIIADTITEMYVKILKQLDKHGQVRSPRGFETKELLGVSCVLNNPRTRHIISPIRRHSLRYVCKELKWYLSGDYNVSSIVNDASFWGKLADKNGNVNSNYGARIWREKFDGKSQFDHIINLLKEDRDSRRAIMFLNMPHLDLAKVSTTKDFPCNVYASFQISNGKLEMLMHQRSADCVWGSPGNDVPFFSMLQELMALKVEAKLGKMYYYYDSLHIYERNYNKLADKNFKDFNIRKESPFPKMKIEDVDMLLKQKYNGDTPFMNKFRQLSGEDL